MWIIIVVGSCPVAFAQEVETEQFYDYFLPELKRDGYDGIFSPKSRAKTMTESERRHVDGCAIFFRTRKYVCSRFYSPFSAVVAWE